MESIIQAIATSVIVGSLTAYVLLKVLEERMKQLRNDVDELKTSDKLQEHNIAQLSIKHDLTAKYMEDFRKEQKEENKLTREVLTHNTSAIKSLETLLERIEKRL
jgi:ferritin